MIAQSISSLIFTRPFLYQSIATITTYVSIRLILFFRQRRRRFNLMKECGIPMPEVSLISGHMSKFRGSDASFLIDEKLRQEFGKYYCIFIGDEPNVIISDKDLLKKVFLENSKSFTERAKPFLNTPLAYGILFVTHQRWKFMRSAMSPAFNRYSSKGESTDFIETSVKLMIDYIETKRKGNPMVEVDARDLMKAMALHLICALAIKLPDVQVKENESHVQSLDAFLSRSDNLFLRASIMFPFLAPIMQFLADHFAYEKTMYQIHKSLDKVVNQDLEKLSPDTYKQQSHVIDTLILLYRERKITKKELIGNVDALLFAGYDTTSTTLSYVFWVLGNEEQLQDKLRNELIAHGVDSEFLTQVINETMRLYPTVVSFVSRLATENVEIGDLRIQRGSRVILNTWLMHRDPDLWPEPEKFDPSRFDGSKEIHPCAFAPFGLGERKCLGYKLAMLEMKMVVCDILLKYRIKTISPAKLELKTHTFALTEPRDPVLVELKPL